MLPFATEFPVHPSVGKSGFIAHLLSWLKGIPDSRVLDVRTEHDIAVDNALMRDERSNEELRVREFIVDQEFKAIGFRHDLPDGEGRTWRTEAVLRRGAAEGGADLLRLRTQCLATTAGARIERPRKPYIVKALLRDPRAADDLALTVSDKVHWLENDDQSMATAVAIVSGAATKYLPVLYLSSVDQNKWAVPLSAIERLAYDLGGIAHVVVEPDRTFSFQLRDRTDGANAYGGNIALALPGTGIVRRFFLGWQYKSEADLLSALRTAVLNTRLQMPAEGWEWTELQEQALRIQRAREKNQLQYDEVEKLYQEEIASLQERIRQMEEQAAGLSVVQQADQDLAPTAFDTLTQQLAPQIYPGEMVDRLRLSAKIAVEQADRVGLDSRSKYLLGLFQELTPSHALNALLDELTQASKDNRRSWREFTRVLCRHGYDEKADNKHVRLEAKKGFGGLDTITLAKTPSDGRGVKNALKQIERTLGLSKIKET